MCGVIGVCQGGGGLGTPRGCQKTAAAVSGVCRRRHFKGIKRRVNVPACLLVVPLSVYLTDFVLFFCFLCTALLHSAGVCLWWYACIRERDQIKSRAFKCWWFGVESVGMIVSRALRVLL